MIYRCTLTALLLLTALTAPSPAQIRVDPVVRGRIVAIGAPPESIVVVVSTPSGADTVHATPTGDFAASMPSGARLGIASTKGTHHPVLVKLPADSAPRFLQVLLVPRVWRIPAGRYRGSQLEIDIRAAFQGGCERCPVFFRRPRAPEGADLFHWTPGVLPLAVAFDRHAPGGRVSAADSSAFWRGVAEMEADAGMDLFRPVTHAEVRDDPERAVIVWEDRSMKRFAGWASFGADDDAAIGTASVAFRSFSVLLRPEGAGLLAHEMTHTLGFGHTCAWASVLADTAVCPERRTTRLTPEDVAYLQLAMAVREAAAKLGLERPWEPTLAAARSEAVLPMAHRN